MLSTISTYLANKPTNGTLVCLLIAIILFIIAAVVSFPARAWPYAMALFCTLLAAGAAFFTLSFPDPDRPQSRRLDRNGVVELRSAATYYWMRGYLFVDDHPYYVATDAEGRFLLADVPPGTYEVVCWLPSWREAKRDLDPETCIVLRLAYRPSVERTRTVQLPPAGKAEVDFSLSGADFGP